MSHRFRGAAAWLFGTAVVVTSASAVAGPDAPTAPAPTSDSAVRERQPLGSVYLDPAGFLLFGPTAGVELGTGRGTGTLYGRWFSGGLLASRLFVHRDSGETFGFSYGVGLRGRYYIFGGMAGPHVGVALEFLATRIEDHPDLIATNSQYLVPSVEGGYRFAFASRFYVGVSGAVGYAVRVNSRVDDLPGGMNASLFQVKDESRVYGSASLDLGVYF